MRTQQLRSLAATARHDPLHALSDVRLAKQAVARNAIQKTTELAPLIAYLRGRQLRTVLEIGTERGGTFWLWCQLAPPNALLVTVDWEQTAVQELAEPAALKKMGRCGQQIVALRSDSHTAETRGAVAGILSGRPVDLLFLDGDHSYDGVRRDFDLYAPLVRKGGLIVLHDVTAHRPETGCEVKRFWRELKLRYPLREFIDPEGDMGFGPWGGIGLIEITNEH